MKIAITLTDDSWEDVLEGLELARHRIIDVEKDYCLYGSLCAMSMIIEERIEQAKEGVENAISEM